MKCPRPISQDLITHLKVPRVFEGGLETHRSCSLMVAMHWKVRPVPSGSDPSRILEWVLPPLIYLCLLLILQAHGALPFHDDDHFKNKKI